MRKISLIIFLSLLFFSFLGSAQAQDKMLPLVQCGLTGANRCTFCGLFEMFDRIVDFFLLRIIPVLAALMIAIGGFMYVISQGNPGTLSKVKSLFTAVVIGLLIVYGAWVVINTFFMIIGVQGWTGLREGWWQINCQ